MKIEIFSCAGGMALGFRRAGIEFDVAVDADPDAVSSYHTNLKHRPLQMDVRDLLRMVELGLVKGPVELLVADPPCTPWSRAGKGKGLKDERDMLLPTCRLIELLQPTAFLVGNVPGLDDSTNWPIVQKTLGAISGYCIDYRALDAADYGIPQHRIRPFWFGHKAGTPCLTWPRPTHGDPKSIGHAELGDDRLPWRTCRNALEHLPLDQLGKPARMRMRACNGKQLGSIAEKPARVVGTSNLSDGNVLTHPDPGARSARVRPRHSAHPASNVDEPAHTLTCEGGRSQSYSHAGMLAVEPGVHTTSDRHPALEADSPSTTIRGGAKGTVIRVLCWPHLNFSATRSTARTIPIRRAMQSRRTRIPIQFSGQRAPELFLHLGAEVLKGLLDHDPLAQVLRWLLPCRNEGPPRVFSHREVQ
jgi:site-specific DNA-cytosine methylase